jgi:lipopolysaccharide/colanic/teichoic acid biosynthesis glycosyltransferase
MLKFRSMTTNAEQKQAELAAMNEMTGPVFKISEDP